MKITELEPQFLKLIDDKTQGYVHSINEADGIMFLCPACFKNNGGNVGTHTIICWQPHIPQNIHPNPGRWNFLGSGYEDLELKAGSSSIALTGGCNAHFFVRNGEIISC